MNILHILNGDATLQVFEQTGLEGTAIVWREVLSEGPLEENIGSAGFWKTRAEFIGKTFHEPPEKYQESVLDQLADLSHVYDKINLWFEFDLHCQVNLLGVMNYLKQKADLSLPSVYLICPSEFPGVENFRGLGELNGEQLEYLYDNIRVQLSEIDFVVAAEAWTCYLYNDAAKLKVYLETNTFWANLQCLKPAMEAHVKRLQVNQKGLNDIEQKLFDIYNSGLNTRPDIYASFWKTEKIYGMGDSEIDIYLNRLEGRGFIKL